MTVHWANLDTEGKIEAIKSVWQPGMSALGIASHFDGATRNAVVGMYHRYPDRMSTCPLQPRGANGFRKLAVACKTCSPSRRPVNAQSKAMPVPAVTLTEPHVAGRPIADLRANQCQYAVNDAGRGETHLFCGLPSDGHWCDFHRRIVYQPRSALRDRSRAA